MNRKLIENEYDSIILTSCRISMVIPSVIATGEPFSIRVTVFGADKLPTKSFLPKINFIECPNVEGLPKSISFSESDGGCLRIDGLRSIKAGDLIIDAILDKPSLPRRGELRSNPAWVMDDPPYRIYWGDLHFHTKYSNCSEWACKDPEFGYAYARDAACLDFAAAADHLRGIAFENDRWPRLCEWAKNYNDPSSFVSFLAFESSHKTGFGGDNNAYFLEDDAPYFWLDRADMQGGKPEVTLEQLWDFLKETGKTAMTVPHHTGRQDKYRDFSSKSYRPEMEPIFEIYSGWGSSENRLNQFPLSGGNSERPAYFKDTLLNGCRYGVIASSDDHTTVPGGETKSTRALGTKRLDDYIHRGLAAIRAPELSREALWKAMFNRQCYATTFSRTLIDFEIGDATMGEEISLDKQDSLRQKREINVRVATSESGSNEVALLRNGNEIERQTLKRDQNILTFNDLENLDNLAIRDAQFHPDPFVAYHIRVENRFKQTQWSSPIWIDI